MHLRRLLSFVLLTATLLVVGAAPASAGFATFTDPNLDLPLGMDEAPDGTLWFASVFNDRIASIDPDTHVITTFTDPGGQLDGPREVAVAPNGVVWFTSSENGRLGKLEAGVMTTYPALGGIDDIEISSTGDVWFNAFEPDGRIGRFQPGTATLTTYDVAGLPLRMTPGPAGSMWFVWFNPGGRIGRILPDGTTSSASSGGITDPADITTGSDGNLWVTGEDDDEVGRFNPTTSVMTTFSHPQLHVPNEIISGPDGDLWFANRSGARLGRLDPMTGAMVFYRDPTDTVEGPVGLAVGGDGNLWYTRVDNRVGRLVLTTCQGVPVTVDLSLGSRPTGARDVILGTPGPDDINALGGDDLACGLGGDDTVNGGVGIDKLFLGAGNDVANGGTGNDQVFGNNGADVVDGAAGADTLRGEAGGDLLLGQDGNDLVEGGDGDDGLSGGPGADTCRGGAGRDTAGTCEAVTGVP